MSVIWCARQSRTPSARALRERVKELEAQLEALSEKSEPQSLEQQQINQAQQLVDSLKRDRIGPFGWTGEGEADGAAAA
jgi:hypothetical protein